MREPLIRISDIPPEGTVTVNLLGREVLVMLLNGRPRAYVNVCMHHGGPLSWKATRSPATGTPPRSTHDLAGRSRARCGRMRG
jgi:nitrite reductase/ring-hydroxylating ferredoxin subunit